MTSPGGGGPIETAFIEIKPQVSPQFAADLRKEILPILKKISKEADKAFKEIGSSSKAASSGVSGLSRSLSGASKSAGNFAKNASAASQAANGLKKASGSASAALRGAGAATDAAGRSAQTSGNRFNFLARALIVGAVYAAGQALTNLGKFGIGAAASLEQTQIAFEGLMGSAEEAQAFTERLQRFAAKTPFEFEGVAKASQRLLALGQTGDEAIKTLTTVGNAAAAVGADETSINRVIVALAQIQAKGKLSAEEINQVGEALPNLNRGKVIENLAESFGVTTEKIREMQQKGLIPAEAGVAALLKTLEEVPGALGAMDRQSATLLGRFSTFKDTIKANFSNALVDSLPILGEALLKLTDTISTQLDTFAPALAGALVTLTPFIEGLVNFLGPLLTGLLTTFSNVFAAFAPALAPIGAAITTILDAFGPALIPLSVALADLAIALTPLITLLGTMLAGALVDLTPLLITVTEAMGSLAGFLAENKVVTEALVIAVVAVFTALKAYAILTAVTGALASFSAGTLAAGFASGGLAGALTAVNVAMKANVIGIVITAVAALVGGLILLYRNSETVREGFRSLGNFAVSATKFMVDKILGYYEFLISSGAKLFSWVPGLGPKLQEAANSVAAFRDGVNIALSGIERNVDIVVRTTYVTAQVELKTVMDEKKFARDSRKKAIAAAKPIVTRTGPRPQFLPSGSKSRGGGGGGKSGADKAASAAKEAAKKVQDALIKLADAALESAKKVADGIEARLDSASDTLKRLRDQFADIRDSIAEAFSVDLFASRNAKQFLRRATKNIVKNTSVFQSQGILQSQLGGQAGGSEFLKQLFQSGNTRLIKNLAAQSSATLADVLAKFNQDNALANKIGTAVASAFVVGGKPLVVGINSVREQVIKLQQALLVALAKVEVATKARERLKAASGGIFNAATNLQVGEAGREVVVPLTRPGAALDLLLRSGALGLPNVAAHLGGLQESAQSASMDRLRAVGLPGGPTYARTPQNAVQAAPPPVLKVVKERVLHQTNNIYGAGDARLTAEKVAARTAAHMDR